MYVYVFVCSSYIYMYIYVNIYIYMYIMYVDMRAHTRAQIKMHISTELCQAGLLHSSCRYTRRHRVFGIVFLPRA